MEPEGGSPQDAQFLSTNVLSFVQNVVFAAESKEELKSDMRPHTGAGAQWWRGGVEVSGAIIT